MTEEEYIELKAEEARTEARDVINNFIRPYEWIDERFRPSNMSKGEFEKIKKEMES